MAVRLCVPRSHSFVARQVNSAASGASVSALRASSRASTLTPLSAADSVVLMSILVEGWRVRDDPKSQNAIRLLRISARLQPLAALKPSIGRVAGDDEPDALDRVPAEIEVDTGPGLRLAQRERRVFGSLVGGPAARARVAVHDALGS